MKSSGIWEWFSGRIQVISHSTIIRFHSSGLAHVLRVMVWTPTSEAVHCHSCGAQASSLTQNVPDATVDLSAFNPIVSPPIPFPEVSSPYLYQIIPLHHPDINHKRDGGQTSLHFPRS